MKKRNHYETNRLNVVLLVILLVGLIFASAPNVYNVQAQLASNTELVGQLGGRTFSAFVEGNLAYVGFGPQLEILNISDPSNPKFVGRTNNLNSGSCGGSLGGGWINEIQVVDGFAYVANLCDGLKIIDVSNPVLPVLVGTYEEGIEDIFISDGYAYLTARFDGLLIIDVTNPYTPSLVGSAGDYAGFVHISGSYAYVTGSNTSTGHALQIFDISDPTAPIEVGYLSNMNFFASDIFYSSGYVYMIGIHQVSGYSPELLIIDVSDPSAPAQKGFYGNFAYVRGLYVNDSIVYVSDGWHGMRVIDVSSPTQPFERGYYIPDDSDSDHYQSVFFYQTKAYIAGLYGGLSILDISNPSEPSLIGSYSLPVNSFDVYYRDNILYIDDSGNCLIILDTTVPSIPKLLAQVDTPGYNIAVELSGDYAYLLGGQDDDLVLRAINVSDSTNPTVDGVYRAPGNPSDLFVKGSYIYVTGEYYGSEYEESLLKIIDISNPFVPTEVGSLSMPLDGTTGIHVSGDYAYVSVFGGVHIIDISNPTAPIMIGFIEMNGNVEGIDVSGKYAYVPEFIGSAGRGFLHIVDISDPTTPITVGTYDDETYYPNQKVKVIGNLAYFSNTFFVMVLDVSNPTQPTNIGNFRTSGIKNLFVQDRMVYLAREDEGILIFRYTGEIPTPTGQIDLSITKTFIRPIQVVEGVNINNDDKIDLVLGKPTVVRVRPIINNNSVSDAGTQLLVSLNFQEITQTKSTTIGEVTSGPSFYLNFTFTPTVAGDGNIVVNVDPTNLINESSEGNNQDSINVSVKETRSLHFAYVPVNFPNMPDHLNETVQNGEEFLVATYPLAPDKVTHNIVAPISLPPAAQLPNRMGLGFVFLNIYLNGKISSPFAERIVGIVPESFFPYYGLPNTGGGSLAPKNNTTVLVRDGYYTSQAHEIGHTYGLWTESGHEEYDVFPPGRPASGYWVERNLAIENSICFMGNSPERFQFNRWIDTEDYVSLFKTLRTNQTDPRVLFVTGFITESGTVEFYKLYKSQQGIVDDTDGEYTLQLLDINGMPIDQKEFGASFDVLDGNIRLEKAPFAFAAALPDNATSLQVIVNGVVKAETNIQSRLLHDAIDSIPGSAFINNPEQRRSALHQKVYEIEAKIEAGDIQGAITKLQKDLKPNVQKWLKNNYVTDNELQYSKSELISLINEIISMYSDMK